MRLSKYQISINDENTYWFISSGRAGNIIKVVLFQQLPENNRFNLALGDYDENTGYINFTDLTNNGDARKVFATVAEIVILFTKTNTEREIFLSGNSLEKKHIYSFMTSAFLNEINEEFFVWGAEYEGFFEQFKKDKNYDGILVKRRLVSTFI